MLLHRTQDSCCTAHFLGWAGLSWGLLLVPLALVLVLVWALVLVWGLVYGCLEDLKNLEH